MPIRVLLVDDQPLLRTGFRMILEAEQDIAVVGEAGDGLQAIDQVRALQPDVVLMDIRMPRMDGVEATRRLRALPEPPQVLVLTTYDSDADIARAIDAGATGYLLKAGPPEELFRGVRAAARGDALIDPGVTVRLIEAFAGSGAAPPEPPTSPLTDREEAVLAAAAGATSA